MCSTGKMACLILIPLLGAVADTQTPLRVEVTTDTFAQTPVSPLLYGNFIELGYGRQVEPMWGELFFNRSFEHFAPYRPISIQWWDLWLDPKNPSKGYEKDWRKFDWYHSGYEHNAWFAAPGALPSFEISEASTFVVETTSPLQVAIHPQPGGVHGRQCMRVENKEAQQWGGLAQAGKYLRKGEGYTFRGHLRNIRNASKVEIALYPEGNWERPIVSALLSDIGGEFQPCVAQLANPAFEGRAVFMLRIPPDSVLEADAFSLVPDSNLHGWRREAIEVSRPVRPSVMRFPGGCFSSFYDWRDGVGPRDARKPQDSPFWGGENANDVGTAECAMLCKELGAQMMFCVNVFHPLKQVFDYHLSEVEKGPHGYDFPQFTDLAAGAQLAADWVAYCNAPVSHPMGKLRAEHGYAEPFGVRYWELDNEVYRWFQADEYARAAVTYARAMKAVDSSIKVGLISYGPKFAENLEAMLDIAGRDIDFLADRCYGEGFQDAILGRLRTYNAAHNTKIEYCNTEWLAFEGHPDAYNRLEMPVTTQSFIFSKWRYAMNVIRNAMMWQRKGGDILFVNFNNFANTHAQCVLETPKEGAYLAATGRAFELLTQSPVAWPLKLEGYTPLDTADVQVQAAWDSRREALVLYLFNMTATPQEAVFSLARLGREFKTAQTTALWADSLLSMNTLAQPDAIHKEEQPPLPLQSKTEFRMSGRPFAFTQTILR